jgi:hypothetical protein
MKISKNIFVIIFIQTFFVIFLLITNNIFLSVGASILFLIFSIFLFFIKKNIFKGVRVSIPISIPIPSFKTKKDLKGFVNAIILFVVFLMLGELMIAFAASFLTLYFHKNVKSSFSYVISGFFLIFSVIVLILQTPMVGNTISFVYLFLLIGLLLQFIESRYSDIEGNFSIPNILVK